MTQAFRSLPDVRTILEVSDSLPVGERDYLLSLLAKLEELEPEEVRLVLPCTLALAECIRSMRQRLDSEQPIREHFAELTRQWAGYAQSLEGQVQQLQGNLRQESLRLQAELDEAQLGQKTVEFDRDIWKRQAQELEERVRDLEQHL
jgi:hypothetical protein